VGSAVSLEGKGPSVQDASSGAIGRWLGVAWYPSYHANGIQSFSRESTAGTFDGEPRDTETQGHKPHFRRVRSVSPDFSVLTRPELRHRRVSEVSGPVRAAVDQPSLRHGHRAVRRRSPRRRNRLDV